MTDMAEILIGDVLALMDTAGEPIVYHRRIVGTRDPATRTVADTRVEEHRFPAGLLEWKTSRPGGEAPMQRRRDIIIPHQGWEPREGDEVEIPREERRYTVTGEARGFTVAGATVAWRLSTSDGR